MIKERSEQLWFELGVLLPPIPFNWSKVAINNACTSMIAAAIRAAVEAEREACARVCDEQAKDVVGEWHGNEDYRIGARVCARIIRARED